MSYKKKVEFYTVGETTLKMYFPENDVSCYHCWMRYKDSCDRQMCRLLNRELYFVKQGIHEDCPLIFSVEEIGGGA